MAERPGTWIAGAAIALALAGAVAFGVWRAQAPPEGPVEVAWDRTRCARCQMLVSDPHFAAQIQTPREVLHFDDPGCLLLYLHEEAPETRAVYFRHAREDRWIPGDRVAFVPLGPTPMGYGLGAVARGAPGSLSWEEALERVLARDAAR